MSDILKKTDTIAAVEFSKTTTGKEKLSVKVGPLYYSIYRLKNDGTETNAWQQAKDIGSANMVGQRFNISYTEYTPEGRDHPYRTIVGLYSPDANTSPQATGDVLSQLKSLELRVAVLEGKVSNSTVANVPTESGYAAKVQADFANQAPMPEESQGVVGTGENGEVRVEDIPF
jgi:hypothetical protein